MRKRLIVHLAIIVLVLATGCVENDQKIPIVNLISQNPDTSDLHLLKGKHIDIVYVYGQINYFGVDLLQDPPQPIPYQTGVEGAKIWLAEYPFTKKIGMTSGRNGFWGFFLIKPAGMEVDFSFVYEKDFYTAETEQLVFPDGIQEGWDTVAVKSNVYTIGSENVVDVAIQMPDELYQYAAKTQLETGLSQIIGSHYEIENLVVSTVGKSWASLFDSRLPHGDPGAVVIADPAVASPLQGPVYFDETVTPNPTYTATSPDGGVLFNNIPAGDLFVTAEKKPHDYDEVHFRIEPGVRLFISTPPHSIQGTNDSGPGEN